MFSLFKKPDEEIVAIFDIGNGSIGGALVKFSKTDHPVILYTIREPITYMPQTDADHLLASMLKLLKSVAEHLAHNGLKHIKTSPFGSHKLKDVYCVFASPWYISQTKTIKEEKEIPFAITKETINDLVKKEQELFYKELKEGKYENLFGPDTRLLEKRVINIRLNGYDVEEPIGKKVKELELTLFSSYISQQIMAEVESTLHAAFAIRNIHHFSYGLVSWNASRIIFPDIHNAFFIDVSGETTDISLIVRDILIETISFPLGRNMLIRDVVKSLSITPDVALSFLALYYDGTLEKKFAEKLTEVIKPIEQAWTKEFTTALTTFQKIYSLPQTAFVTADLDIATFFLNAMQATLPVELNLPKNSLAVTFIGADKVQPYVYELRGIKHDSFIGIESIFLNELFTKNN